MTTVSHVRFILLHCINMYTFMYSNFRYGETKNTNRYTERKMEDVSMFERESEIFFAFLSFM